VISLGLVIMIRGGGKRGLANTRHRDGRVGKEYYSSVTELRRSGLGKGTGVKRKGMNWGKNREQRTSLLSKKPQEDQTVRKFVCGDPYWGGKRENPGQTKDGLQNEDRMEPGEVIKRGAKSQWGSRQKGPTKTQSKKKNVCGEGRVLTSKQLPKECRVENWFERWCRGNRNAAKLQRGGGNKNHRYLIEECAAGFGGLAARTRKKTQKKQGRYSKSNVGWATNVNLHK